MPHDIASPFIADLKHVFEQQKAAARATPYPCYAQRMDRLDRIKALLAKYEQKFIQAINEDFGNRSVHETLTAEIMPAHLALSKARWNLKSWMKIRRAKTNVMFWPGNGRIAPQPLGVVGIIAPWNYPGQLSLCPIITAIAAGNNAIVRPSELTPRFGETLKEAVGAYFTPEEIAVVLGPVEVSKALTSMAFDHIIFTGSTSVGRKVAVAAAANLTPVTLELGGKSPAIIDVSADTKKALRRIIKGKLFSAGQTCIAPDYLIVPDDQIKAIAQMAIEVAKDLTSGPDAEVTSIINDQHFERLTALVVDAQDKGANVIKVAKEDAVNRKLPLTILTNLTDEMLVMQDEIFGPILPIISATSTKEVRDLIQSRPRPLALYWFGDDPKTRNEIIENVHAGTVGINDVLLQIVQHNLPFGGVGDSGYGSYHGKDGFDRLSHLKAVFSQSKFAVSDLFRPPYSKLDDRIARLSVWWASR